MPLSVKKKKTVVYSSIIILILIFGVIFPTYHVYNRLLEGHPAITVIDGHYNVTYGGDFKNITDTADAFVFSTNASMAVVTETGYPNSTLDVQATNGGIFYYDPGKVVTIIYNLSVNGHFNSNLRPESLTLSFSAMGANQSSVLLTTEAPPQSTLVPSAKNLSPNTLGNLRQVGPGNVSVTTKLLNESSNVAFYNFHVSVQMWLTVKWYSGSTHMFNLSAQVNGLSKSVNSTLSIMVKEVS